MTHSPTPAELLAIRTGNAALLNSPDAACDIVATIVFALGSAGLLMDPETAEELRKLRASRPADEDPIAYTLTPKAEDVSPQVKKLRALIAGQREDQYVSELHRDYKTPHDLPPVTGACDACGDGPDRWCPDCAACRRGCHNGNTGDCTHPNAPWAVTP